MPFHYSFCSFNSNMYFTKGTSFYALNSGQVYEGHGTIYECKVKESGE